MPVVYFTILHSEFIQSKNQNPLWSQKAPFLFKNILISRMFINYETLYHQLYVNIEDYYQNFLSTHKNHSYIEEEFFYRD